MIKKSASQLKRAYDSTFKFRFWLDSDRLQSFGSFIKRTGSRLFILRPEAPRESFNQAARRLNLTDELIEKRKLALYRLSFFMVFLAVLLFLYVIYQLIYGGFGGVLVSAMVMLIPLALAFRYHFWYFQLKQKKLGCSAKEWFKQGLLGGNKT